MRNQKDDGIRSLYIYSALLLSVATQSASYATTATPEKFWAKWTEQFADSEEENAHKQALKQPGAILNILTTNFAELVSLCPAVF